MQEEHPPCHLHLHHLPDKITKCPQPPQPGLVAVDDQEEYEVKKILDSKFRWGKLWYLVKFLLGWSNSDNMWLPHTDIHAPTTVQEFHLEHPDAPSPSLCSPPTAS